MQDQGKRLLIAVALALGVMFAWQALFPPKKEEPKPAPTSQKGSGSAAVTPAVGAPQVTADAPDQPAAAAKPRGPEQKITLTFPRFTAVFSSYGGALTSWHLKDERYDRDPSRGELLTPSEPATGAFIVKFTPDSTYKLPANAEWTGTQVSPTQLKYTLTTDQLAVEKTYDILPDAFLVKLTVKVTVIAEGEAHETVVLRTYEKQDPKHAGGGSSRIAAREWQSSTMRGGSIVQTEVTGLLPPEGYPRYENNIEWTGFEHPYLLVGIAPKPVQGQTVDKHTAAEGTAGLMRTDMVFHPAAMLKKGGASSVEVAAYLGPKNYKQLESADDAAGFSTGFKTVIDLGWFAFIGKPLLWLMLKFHELLGNWGLAIVLLTFLVKAATIYWTTKSMRSMKAMAVLGPQMKELQAKYKDDKQRLQLETMALYKQYGVNPLSGCLPIVLQMPIWLALYRMLSSAGELYLQPFIPGWIDDLTGPDPTYVLPIILVVTMFLQARLTPQSVDPAQKMQQRMMQYGMPLMFGVMSFFFPSGLTLYIFTNTCLSALHSIYMNKFDKPSLAFAAQMKADKAAAAAAKNAPAAVKDAKDANVKSDDDPARVARNKPRKKKGRR